MGLPIEHKVDGELGEKKRDMTQAEVQGFLPEICGKIH